MLCAVQARLAVGGLVFLDYHLLANALVARHLVDESIFSWLEIEEAKKSIPFIINLVVAHSHVVAVEQIHYAAIERQPLVGGAFFVSV